MSCKIDAQQTEQRTRKYKTTCKSDRKQGALRFDGTL